MLSIRNAAGHTWSIVVGSTASGFLEGETYTVGTVVADAVVLIDDIPLTRRAGANQWYWTPGFYAGKVQAEVLDGDGKPIAIYGLEIGNAPAKLGQPQFLYMVNEILEAVPALLLGDGASGSEFGQSGNSASREVGYARMRRYGQRCVDAFKAVCAHPLMRLQQERRTVQPHQVRRLDVRSAQELSRGSAVGALLDLNSGDSLGLKRISVPHVEPTFDHGANRTMMYMVDRLIARVAELERWLIAGGARIHDERLSARLSHRCRVLAGLDRGLRNIKRYPVFRTVTRPEISVAGLNAISAQPDYGRAYQLAWKALNMGVLGDGRDDPLPMGPTWQIYERWCFLRVSQLLRAVAPSVVWGDLDDGRGSDAGRLELRGRMDNAVLTLYLQPLFPAWDNPSRRRFNSLSRQREPDIVLTIESPQARRFLVLDAKYRVSRSNVLDAMQSAHIYRDSLRWDGQAAWGSFLLIPKSGAADWLAASEFHEKFKVGTFELAPEIDSTALMACLERFLSEWLL